MWRPCETRNAPCTSRSTTPTRCSLFRGDTYRRGRRSYEKANRQKGLDKQAVAGACSQGRNKLREKNLAKEEAFGCHNDPRKVGAQQPDPRRIFVQRVCPVHDQAAPLLGEAVVQAVEAIMQCICRQVAAISSGPEPGNALQARLVALRPTNPRRANVERAHSHPSKTRHAHSAFSPKQRICRRDP